MHKKCRKLIVLCLAVCMVLTQTYLTGFAASGVSNYKRLSGNNRYKTAVAISQNGWKTSESVVLARGDDYADALCAGPLAKKYGAPILLTEKEKLNAGTLAELKRLGVKNVFIVGGYGAISSNVESALTAAGMKCDRIYGVDRYETSIKIAERLGAVNKIVLATGSDFPDALSISAIASKVGMPILLTEKDNLPYKVKKYISGKSITKTYVIGGTGVISNTVESLVPGAVRLGGKDRFETNTKVMENFRKDLNFSNIYVTIGGGPRGDEFADALSGAVLAARTASPVILTSKALPAITENYLKSRVVLGAKVTALGGEAAVPQSVIDSITALVDKIEVKVSYDKAGTYGPAGGTETIAGNVVIGAKNVILQNTIIEGDLLLPENIGDGSVTLKGVTVKGTTVIRGGRPNSIIMYNFKGETVIVNVPDGSSVRLVAQGSTSVGSVTFSSDGKLEESDLTGNGFITVEIIAGAAVTLFGDFDCVNVAAAGASVNVESGRINTLNVTESASGADINIAGNARVTTLEANAPVDIRGTGAITTANVNSEGVTIAQTPMTTNLGKDVKSATVGGKTVTDSTTTISSGGSSKVYVKTITITGADGATTVANGETLQMNAAVTPTNATNQTVTWSVKNETGTATIDPATGVLSAAGAGTVTVTAKATDGSGVTGSVSITVIPAAPSYTINYITEKTKEIVPATDEYSFDNGTSWTAGSNTEIELIPGQNVQFRVAAAEEIPAGKIQTLVVKGRPSAPSYSVNFVEEKIEGFSANDEYSLDAFATPGTMPGAGDLALTAALAPNAAGREAKTLSIRTAATESSFASAVQVLSIPARPSNSTVKDYTIDYETEKTVQEVPDTEEYSTDGGITWHGGENKNCSLVPGANVDFRLRATETDFASESKKLMVPARPSGSRPTFTYAVGVRDTLLGLPANASNLEARISSDSGVTWSPWTDITTDTDGKAALDHNGGDLIQVRTKAVAGIAFAGESAQQYSKKAISDLNFGDKVEDKSWTWEHKTRDDYTGSGTVKPVTWIVVAKNHYGEDSGVTLLSQELIGRYMFDNSTNVHPYNGSNHWGNSNHIRPWLNSSFYNTFSEEFKNAVLTTNVPNKTYENADYVTKDNVFIPSTTELGDEDYTITYKIGEVYPFFAGAANERRIAKLGSNNSTYWTRSPRSRLEDLLICILANGSQGEKMRSENSCAIYNNGIRPALNLSPDVLVSGAPNADGVYEIFYERKEE